MALLRTENVDYVYGAGTPFVQTALAQISFSLEKNEFAGMVGATGSGKSTLIKLLNGLLRPKNGRVFFQEQDIWKKGYDLQALRFSVGLSFQYPEHQIFSDTVREDIAYGLKNQGISEDLWDEKIREAIEIVGLDESYLSKSPFRLSGGEIRRVALAGTMVVKPQVLVLDEPTAGLDPIGRKMVYHALKRFQKESESTILVVSHSMDDVAEYADSLIVMDHGKIVDKGTPAQIFANTANLEKTGLAVPEVTRLLKKIKTAGFSVQDTIYTMEDAKNELLKLLKGEVKDE